MCDECRDLLEEAERCDNMMSVNDPDFDHRGIRLMRCIVSIEPITCHQ